MRKIGNVLRILLFCFIASLHAQEQIELELTVKTSQGLPLQEAGVNKPFIAIVTLKGAGDTGKIFVDTHSAFDLRALGTTNQMHSINGVSTRETTHQYSVRAKEVGIFTLGPAVVTLDGTVYTSNSIDVTVAQNPVERVTLHEPKLELIVPEGPIVVGQMIPISLRFYHLGVSQLSAISSSQIPGFADNAYEGPFKGTADIDGVPHDYVEWRTEIVAEKEGTFVFQPARAAYSMQSRDRMNIWQQLSDRFSFGMQQYETYSESVQVTVDPLPPYKGKVDAVGRFTNIQALVNQTSAKQGEGILYTLEVTGDGSVKELKHPALEIPDTLTSYESKSSMPTHKPHAPHEQRKSFEYVIQARTPGQVSIPAQTFTFYDPRERRYKQLTTEPITLTIQEDKNAQSKAQANAQPDDQEDTGLEDVQTHTQPLPLFTQGVAEFRADTGINPLLFWGLFWLLVGGLMLQWCRFFWQAYCERNRDYLRSRAAFHKASKRLVHARRERNARELYGMFVHLCADRRGIVSSEVLESDMVAWLSQAKIPDDTIKQWQQYITQLQTVAFYDAAYIPPADVFNQAEKWLALLEKTL